MASLKDAVGKRPAPIICCRSKARCEEPRKRPTTRTGEAKDGVHGSQDIAHILVFWGLDPSPSFSRAPLSCVGTRSRVARFRARRPRWIIN